VLLPDAEITRLAAFKGMSERDFIQKFARLRADRRGLALQENPDGSCVFLEGENCAVQPVKPQKCREFPNLWNFPGFEKVCHAVAREVCEAEYHRRIAQIKARGNDR
jgi:Fe-S-cluster containining protein